ncbi:uncharacterized protein GIQ15_04964 [Arthroderma uncinatum]|uniref:uncharacterized protein n=1 Tax=Arthroderma uncinatum TaxID=74035 RepID=UPI00144AA410|nr:uncharacterized protein GIQ15_04964 [Arthroderma uncinatum]KAF3482205.1 hypothetical protein GIQ15_04964 [Arthroderma uncinatum]
MKEPGERNYSDIRWQLILLGLFRFSEALAWTTIFPYAFPMMKSFLPENDAQAARAAVLASSTVSLFTFGEFLTSVPWAKVSDRIGRKWTLMIGVASGIVSALVFGLSKNLGVALAARAFGGLANPNVGVVSTSVGELVKNKRDQGKAFSVVPFLRALGSLIGPVIGGWLADPTNTIPSIFSKGSIWEKYPYLLPNLVVVLSIAGSGLLGFFLLEETHPRFQDSRNVGLEMSQWLFQKTRIILGYTDTQKYTTLSPDEDSDIPLQRGEDVEMSSVIEPNEPIEEENDLVTESKPPIKSAYTLQVILQILAASIIGFHKVSSDVIIPIFLAQSNEPTSGGRKRDFFEFTVGFGMTSPSISNILLSQAVVAVIAQMFIVPKVISHLGPLKVFRWVAFIFPWLYCLTPFTARLDQPLSTIFLLIDLWIKGVLISLGYTASNILLTNTSPSPLHLATINGANASMGSLARSVGAAVSGSMFHLGLQYHAIGLPFWALTVVAGIGAILSRFLRDGP